MKFCAATLLAILSAACLKPAWAADSVTLREDARAKTYHIDGQFEVEAPLDKVWDVLTDYGRLSGTVSTLTMSRILERGLTYAYVEQVMRGRWLFFSKEIRLLLKIAETPMQYIAFEEVSGTPFGLYRGSWSLSSEQGRTQVRYLLDVTRGATAPPFVERGLFKNNSLALLKELKGEVLRRLTITAGVRVTAANTGPPLLQNIP